MKLKDYINDKPILETNKLILRTLKKEDVCDLKEWLGDKSIYTYWGKRPGKNDLNPELLLKSQKDLQKAFVGVLFTNKTIK